tara:strand:- start:502 stop:1521 length:1020 start_codon:yes stop_codon:yes gene_type:complete
MKNLSIFDRAIFIINSFVALIFTVSLLIPYINPSVFPYLSIFGLFFPVLILLNICFVIYWVIKFKKQFLLSFLILLIGSESLLSFISFSKDYEITSENKISLISYNVRLFNIYNWSENNNVINEIQDFLNGEKVDIICLQEYQNSTNILEEYPFRYENVRGNNLKYGQAIFSKYPIINNQSLNFNSGSNNAIFSDIIIKNDTIRVYNIHLESFSFGKEISFSDINTDNEKLVRTLSSTFIEQQKQVEQLKSSIAKSPYKVVLSGDFNNTAFSYVYKELSRGLKDSFREKGNGFGITFNYNLNPMRIDFILVDNSFQVSDFKTYNVNFSDHYPIYSEFYH